MCAPSINVKTGKIKKRFTIGYYSNQGSYIIVIVRLNLTECNANMYGANCSLSCGNCRGTDQCHHVNGSCLEGCDPGFQGDKCSQGISNEECL